MEMPGEHQPPLRHGAIAAGTARVDITPPLGGSLAGGYVERASKGVADPLIASAVVARDSETCIAIVTADLHSISACEVQRIRHLASSKCGIPPGHIMVTATHTHTGPKLPRPFTDNSQRIDHLIFPGEVDEAYVDFLVAQMASAVEAAAGVCVPCPTIAWAEIEEPDAAIIRRLTEDGAPAAQRDTNQGTGVAAGSNGLSANVVQLESPPAAIVNFGCHPADMTGELVSADYVGWLRAIVEAAHPKQLSVLFLQGCCGDVGTGLQAERLGRVLVADYLKSTGVLRRIPLDTVGSVSRVVEVPVRQIPGQDLAHAQRVLADPVVPASAPAKHLARAVVSLAAVRERPFSVEVHALRLGNVGFVGLPAEPFHRVGENIRKRSPFPFTVVCGLANGCLGYVPALRAFREAGYETTYRSAPLFDAAAEQLTETALELLQDLWGAEP